MGRYKFVLAAITVTFLLVVGPSPAVAQSAARRAVLVLHTYPQGSSATREQFESGLYGALRTVGDLDVHTETFEPQRFPGAAHAAVFRDYLAHKYQGRKISVVVAVWDPALNFVVANRDLFPGASIVATVTRGREFKPQQGITTITAGTEIRSTVELAQKLRPSTRKVVVVNGTSNLGTDIRREIASQLATMQKRPEVVFLTDLPIHDVVAAVRNLKDDSVVLYLRQTISANGGVVNQLNAIERIHEISPVPLFGVTDPLLGRGVTGGVVYKSTALGELAGRTAIRILEGQAAHDIPTQAMPTQAIFDWRELKRWGISLDQLPAGSEILFRERTFWEQYRNFVMPIIALVFFQTALITGLLLQRTRRRQAEGRLSAQEWALRASFERIKGLGGRLIAAQEAERSRIARELHDDLSQKIALLSIDAQQLARHEGVTGAAVPRTRALIERTAEIAKHVHNLSHELHPAKLKVLGLGKAIQYLCRDMNAAHHLEIDYVCSTLPPRIDEEVALCVFRLAQEALSNVVKHSEATKAALRLSETEGSLQLLVSDNGRGIDAARQGRGLGIVSMRERVTFVGGDIEIDSSRESGTHITAWVPLKTAEEASHQPEVGARIA